MVGPNESEWLGPDVEQSYMWGLWLIVVWSSQMGMGWWWWPPHLHHQAQLEALSLGLSLTQSIPQRGLLPEIYKPPWCKVWSKAQRQKEVGFLWWMYHCAIAVNSWRAQISEHVSPLCPWCQTGLNESVLLRFHSCPRTQAAWEFALSVVYTILNSPKVNQAWPGLTWQQCLLGSKLLRKMSSMATIGSLLWGSVFRYYWLDRNAIYFSKENWKPAKMEHLIWEVLIDHAWTAWHCTK